MVIQPGGVAVFPADVDIDVTFHRYPSRHVYVHYELPPGRLLMPVAAMQNLGLRFEGFFAEMEQLIATIRVNRLRAEVRLWDLLWELTERHAASASPSHHPAVQAAMHTIELRLGSVLRVEQIADAVGVSHNHLTRLFRREMGMTVVAYIRRRRIEQARRLIEHSTRPIKSIAAEVGLIDLQHFNKLIRRELGTSPRSLRSR